MVQAVNGRSTAAYGAREAREQDDGRPLSSRLYGESRFIEATREVVDKSAVGNGSVWTAGLVQSLACRELKDTTTEMRSKHN